MKTSLLGLAALLISVPAFAQSNDVVGNWLAVGVTCDSHRTPLIIEPLQAGRQAWMNLTANSIDWTVVQDSCHGQILATLSMRPNALADLSGVTVNTNCPDGINAPAAFTMMLERTDAETLLVPGSTPNQCEGSSSTAIVLNFRNRNRSAC